MYDKTCLRVLEQIYLTPQIHKRELSKRLKLSMPSIEHALKKLNKVLKEAKSGNRIICCLDYSNKNLTPMLYAVEYSRFEKLPLKTRLAINDFLKELNKKPLLAIIFGSYAKGNYTQNSDIDLLLVYQSINNPKFIENTAKIISLRTNTKINPVYLDYNSFRKSFHDRTKEFFKNLKENKIILMGIEWWREIEDEQA